MVTKLQSIDPGRLGKEVGPRGSAWSSLGRGNRIDFVSGLGTGEDMRGEEVGGGRRGGQGRGGEGWGGEGRGGEEKNRREEEI